jgi:hypothetical protein
MISNSGRKRKFVSGATRDLAIGKGRYDLLPPTAIARVARRYQEGGNIYGDRNWERGMPLHVFIDSALRHIFLTLAGDDQEDHMAAVVWNILGFMHTEYQITLGRLPITLDDISRDKGKKRHNHAKQH